MRSIFTYMFAGILISVVVVVFTLAGIFVSGLEHSVAGWNIHRDQQLENQMLPPLSRLHHTTGTLHKGDVRSALSPFLAPNIYVYVTDKLKRPLFLFVHGKRVSVSSRTAVQSELRRLGPRLSAAAPIIDNGSVVGELYAGTFGFRHDIVNQIFLRNLFATLLGGIVVSLCLAFGIGYFYSRRISRQAAFLSRGIGAIASGRRDVPFRSDGASELRSISLSARALQERLSNIERLRRESSQDIAHDLKTPITAIKTQVEAMTDGVISPTRARLRSLSEEVEHIEHLANDLNELIRMESAKVTLRYSDIDPCVLLAELRKAFVNKARERDITLRINCKSANFRADRHLLIRALSNLLDNAVRYAPCGDTVCIETNGTPKEVHFIISNTGSIPTKERDLLFERFYRGENARSLPGTGLGLPIARTIARLHGGSLFLSQENRQTRVTMSMHR